MGDFSWDVVDTLVEDLVGAGVKATLDPAKVNLPGALVQPLTLAPMLAGWQIRVRVVLLAKDTSVERSMASLGALLVAASAVVDPDDQVTTATFVLPDGTAYPAIIIPVDLWTETPALSP